MAFLRSNVNYPLTVNLNEGSAHFYPGEEVQISDNQLNSPELQSRIKKLEVILMVTPQQVTMAEQVILDKQVKS